MTRRDYLLGVFLVVANVWAASDRSYFAVPYALLFLVVFFKWR